MAEAGEEKDAGGSEGEDEENEFPIGFRFVPDDVELIAYYLLPKLQGRPSVSNDAIIEANVYECHPDMLIDERYKSRGEDGAWYFLSPRARMYENGVRPSRKTEDRRGRWKASTATEVAEKTVAGGIQFCWTVLNYFEGSPKDEERTKWIMRELNIPAYEIKLEKNGPKKKRDKLSGVRLPLDTYVLCKIYVSPSHKPDDDDDDGESTSSASEDAQHSEGTAASKFSAERQAAKRPVVEQTPSRATRKRHRQQSLTIGSTQASGAGNNVSASAAYYGIPGQPMARLPRPAGMHDGQAPVQRPPGAYSGQAPVQRTPIPMQFPSNSAATFPNSFGRPKMTMRPPNLANQVVRPPCFPGMSYRPQVSLHCCYEQDYRTLQPSGNASYAMQQQGPTLFRPPQQPQQPYFGGYPNHHVRTTVPRCPPSYNYHPYQHSPMTPAAGGDHCGATPVSGAADQAGGTGGCNINAEHLFVELATMDTSLAGERPQTVPDHRVEWAVPIGGMKLEAEMEETSKLQQDVV